MRFPTIALTALALTSAAKGLSPDGIACANRAGRELYKQQGPTYRECMKYVPEKGWFHSAGDKVCIGKTWLQADTKLDEALDQVPACQRHKASNFKRTSTKHSAESDFEIISENDAEFLSEAYKGFHEQRKSPLQRLKDKCVDAYRDFTKEEL